MYQKDYILRMLEMMGDFIAAILAKMKKKDYEKASEILENSYQTLLRNEAGFFYKIPVNEMTQKLIGEHNFTNSHLEILAELFLTEAELRFEEKKLDQSSHCYEKSKILLTFLEENSGSLSIQRNEKLKKIDQRTHEIKLIQVKN